ncbi:MAG: hypothetical protein CO128_07075 [Ignavibacteriales bacterium CG_4_9_14_3_um_filter_30_11]|nr:MAG: hypothetical protein CO128_07075 [Ignavibacteriales bacterium CG_4_9_14_3_um_filter_30_11]
MKLIKSYFNGISSTLKKLKILSMLYVLTLIFALAVAIPFKDTISTNIGSSLAAIKLLKDFDYTTYSNFMHLFGDTIKPLYRTAFLLGIIYMLFFVFFSGGILSSIKNNTNSLSQFWADSWTYFPRFFRLFLYSFLVMVIITILVFFPIAGIIAAVSNSTKSEETYFYIISSGIIIYLFLISIIVLVSDYSKIMLISDNAFRPFRTMLRSVSYIFKHFFSIYGMNLLFIITGLALFVLYFIITDKVGMVSGFTIFIIFLIQQLFITCRLFLKISIYGGEVDLVKKIG